MTRGTAAAAVVVAAGADCMCNYPMVGVSEV